jgi:hypothetical protein
MTYMVADTASALPPYATSLCICQNFIGSLIKFSSTMECPPMVQSSYHILGTTVLVQKLKAGWGGTRGNVCTVLQSHKPTYCLFTLPLVDEWDSTILLTFILPGQGGRRRGYLYF